MSEIILPQGSSLNKDFEAAGHSPLHDTIDPDEAVLIAAANIDFFNHYYFPKAFPDESPDFHLDMQQTLLKPGRYKAYKVFRGGSKTTNLRAFTAWRIVYELLNLGMIVSESSRHSTYTLQWLKTQVTRNKLFSETYHLYKGDKWAENEIEIVQCVPGKPDRLMRLLGFGITGQIRGFNFDDDRPDLILVDDVCNEENTNTPEGREKITKLVMGALVNGLASPARAPHALMAIAQTPLDEQDLISQAAKSSTFQSNEYSCFDEEGNSVWESQHPTAFLKQNKQDYIARNQLSLWMSEMEVTIVSAASADFKQTWLKVLPEFPEDGVNIMSIDPTPPPKPTEQIGKGTAKRLDTFSMGILNIHPERGVTLIDSRGMKQPTDPEIFSNMFSLTAIHRPLYIFIETILFARTIANSITSEMLRTGEHIPVIPIEDKRSKRVRIVSELSKLGFHGLLSAHESQVEFIEQFLKYPNVDFDDYCDMVAIGIMGINQLALTREGFNDAVNMAAGIKEDSNDYIEHDDSWRSCP